MEKMYILSFLLAATNSGWGQEGIQPVKPVSIILNQSSLLGHQPNPK